MYVRSSIQKVTIVESSEIAHLDVYGETDWSLIFKRELILKRVSTSARDCLDLGCGAGHLAKSLLDRRMNVVAFDLDLEALQRAERRYDGPMIRGNAVLLPLDSGVFDIVVCSDLLEHVHDDIGVLDEIHRVLRPRARLILTVPAMHSLWSQHDVRLGHVRRYEREDLCKRLRMSGFTVVQAFFWASFLFPATYLVRKLAPRYGRSGGVTSRRQRELILRILRVEKMLPSLPFGVSLLAIAEKRV